MEDSPILLKQEKDIVNTILRYLEYSESNSLLAIELTRFEGKHFRHLTPGVTPARLLNRIKEILIMFKQAKLVNDFTLPSSIDLTLNSTIKIDIKHKIGKLKQYWIDLDKKIGNITAKRTSSQDQKLYSKPRNMHPNILAHIPNTKLTRKVIRPMAKVFDRNGVDRHINNDLLFQYIESKVVDRSYKISQKTKNRMIENRIRTIRKYIEPLGLTIKRRFNHSYLSYLES